MPASPPYKTFSPLPRTSIVLVAFCVGIGLGFLVSHSFGQCRHASIPGEERSRAAPSVIDEGGTHIIMASFCDVYREFAETHRTPGPIRFRVHLSRIVDGDTVRVQWHGENLSVRLLGIDAPERGQPGGPESTQCLRELLAGADTVDLEFQEGAPRRDSLGRLLAYVWRGDSLLNLELVKRGHAGLYKGGGKGKYSGALRHAAQSCGE